MAKTQSELLEFLAGLSIETTTVSHPALYTVEDSQKLRGEIAGGHSKNLFLKDKKDNFFLISLEESAVIDLKQVHKKIGASSRVSFGKPEKLMEFLGVIPGAVTPFGIINDENSNVTLILDHSLMAHDVLNFHPLSNEATTTINRTDLIAFAEAVGHKPMILNLSQ